VPDAIMAMNWVPVSPVEGFLSAGRHGRAAGVAGVVACLRSPLSIVQVVPLAGQRQHCLQRLAQVWGVSSAGLDVQGRVAIGACEWVWSGPDRFVVLDSSGESVSDVLQARLEDHAAVIDQSDGRFVLRLSGAAVRQTLAKGVGIDLHPSAFGADATALTQLCHLGVQLTRIGGGDVFDLMGPRAAADDLCDWLLASAAQYGLQVEL